MNLPPIPADAPFLFENQELPFAGDIHMEGEMLKLRDQFGIGQVFETGTCYGSTTLWFAAHFKAVATIELNPTYGAIARTRLDAYVKENPDAGEVDLLLGDSGVKLAELLAQGTGNIPSLFFLDAHFEEHCPLLQELAAIAEAHLRPVIVIHDFQVPGRPDLGYDTWEGQPFRFGWIRPSLDRIYGANGYGHYFNSMATGAKRGVIYIHPLP